MIKQNSVKKGSERITLIDDKTLEALIRCKNELYNIYAQFGGISNIHLSKGLSFEGADWNAVNNWEVDNMDDDDDPAPVKKESKPSIDVNGIANNILAYTKKMGALRYLNSREIIARVEDYFEDDGVDSSDKLILAIGRISSITELAFNLQNTFGIDFGPYDNWLNYITIEEFCKVLLVVQENYKD